MNPELSNAIKQAALEFWIDYNYEVAQGRKEGEEWLDEEEEDIINVPKERCEICDRDAYHENDWHCSQGKEKEE